MCRMVAVIIMPDGEEIHAVGLARGSTSKLERGHKVSARNHLLSAISNEWLTYTRCRT